MNTANAAKCGTPNPRTPSYRCQKPAGHDGDHVARRRGRPSHQWTDRPTLPVFAALMKGLTR